MISVSGPFLSVPVLTKEWPDLAPLEASQRDGLRRAHADWQEAGEAASWIEYVLRDLLGWADAVQLNGDFSALEIESLEHEAVITPSFVLTDPATGDLRLLGLVSEESPVTRVRGDDWPATPADRLAQLCRARGVELGLATDGRQWALVWAPAGGVTTVAVFDAISWPESAERTVVRAFISLLERRRWFVVPEDSRLPALLRESLRHQEDLTEQLGVQVRQAVEMLVAAFARSGVMFDDVPAADVYRGAVAMMMRLVFLLFAEESGLLPADNPLYAAAYSASRLHDALRERVADARGNEAELDHTYLAWHRLLALFTVVFQGVNHPELRLVGHDGSLFSPAPYPWLPLTVDDRTVLHMLRSVQTVTIAGEQRTVSFRTLTVEQIGYVYEGLLSFEGFRADKVVVSLIGKAGREEEVYLSDLEALGLGDDLPIKLAEKYKDSGIGSVRALTGKLAPLSGDDQAQAESRLYAVAADHALVERLLPYCGIIRRDLRGDPVVILPGQLYVTESKLRASTGTHYTPRFLATQVAEGALEPLVYQPGPLQTADRTAWKLRSPEEILSLRVADIAMGSGAFLVAACRYLARKLIQAWSEKGNVDALRVVSASPVESGLDLDVAADPVIVKARRQIIEHCLYGVDINGMAVEMAKLSLWLVSMDSSKPFTFLDDKLAVGDSLLGITSVEQLEWMHLDPEAGRALHDGTLLDFMAGVRRLLVEVAEQRRLLVDIPDDPGGLLKKRELLAEIQDKTADLSAYADLIVGTGLARGSWGDTAKTVAEGPVEEVRERAERLLATDQPDGGFGRRPVHWPLVFPEIGGFDAIIGNPPFLGGSRITGPFGVAYREYLINNIADGVRAGGRCDLVAYFLLRAHLLLNAGGQAGLIATNTLTQGDTRSVGLDRLVANGVEIRRSVKSRPWPSRGAILEYAAVWTSCQPISQRADRVTDDIIVSGITSSLEAASRVAGIPRALVSNTGVAFQGTLLLGTGFTMTPSRAMEIIGEDPRMRKVLAPYVSGQDLNSRPDTAAGRWVIDFHDWSEEEAQGYPIAYTQVLKSVKPERERVKRQAYRNRWWQHAERGRNLYEAIAEFEYVIAIARVSRTAMPVMVAGRQVMSEMTITFASDDYALLALLSSAAHYWWAISHSSTMKADLRYSPSDVFETLPLTQLTSEMRSLGYNLSDVRRNLMLSRQIGLTATYNLVHNSSSSDADICELRQIHGQIDEATIRAYGWGDLADSLGHDFHETRQGIRYTVAPTPRQEILDRLLELNHARYAEEEKVGLHNKRATRKRASAASPANETLF